jgi:hypothetical protein
MEWFNYTGPSSYANGTSGGDEVDCQGVTGAQSKVRGINSIITGISVSGLYTIEAWPSATSPTNAGPGPLTWYLRWMVISTGLEVGNGVNLSGEKSIIAVIGG